ncbi:HCP-like protein [Gonapodya prolifera JEL478]|uniref:HCP-like protein n=1 Tax=Gonapodya prolifera (strain JEL478) TaxID=1344416 RepID=A0A139ABM2_GONPJ|nr:HCP-like protein [Gonapodya prolifera JEL478]|eukprot:KXS14206.1 HCP-like protein [Gonapodya prolifera JEL478]
MASSCLYNKQFAPPERLLLDYRRGSHSRGINTQVTKSGDVYAFGLTIAALWRCSNSPYDDVLDEDDLQDILDGRRTCNIPNNMPSSLIGLMQRCWSRDAGGRPTFKEVVSSLEDISPNLVSERPLPSNVDILDVPILDVVDAALAFENAKNCAICGDMEQAIRFFKFAAERGHVQSQYELAEWCKIGLGLYHRDEELAFYWFRRASESNHDGAICALGDFYLHGMGKCPLDKDSAMDYYLRAADLGNSLAQKRLHLLDPNGNGQEDQLVSRSSSTSIFSFEVPEDGKADVRLCRNAASLGDKVAQYKLGVLYDNGWSVAKNDHEAIYWYSIAADEGYSEAQYALGGFYEIGRGVEKDPSQALAWYIGAAYQGHALALCSVGRFFDVGIGVERSEEIAEQFYRDAAAKGLSEASSCLTLLEKRKLRGSLISQGCELLMRKLSKSDEMESILYERWKTYFHCWESYKTKYGNDDLSLAEDVRSVLSSEEGQRFMAQRELRRQQDELDREFKILLMLELIHGAFRTN